MPHSSRRRRSGGIFAYITDDVGDWQSAIDIVLRRFTEYNDLEGAFGRRAVTERAKGILMERHSIDEAKVFEMLRDHSRDANRKVTDGFSGSPNPLVSDEFSWECRSHGHDNLP